MPTHIPTTDALLGLAEAVVIDGFGAHRTALAELVQAARRAGVRPVLVDIVDDDTSPVVARQRALGRVIVALSTAVHDIAVHDTVVRDAPGATSLAGTAA